MSDSEMRHVAAAREIMEQTPDGTENAEQPLGQTPAIPRKRGPLKRTSVYIDVPIREEIKNYAEERGARESDIIRASLALGLQNLKRPYTAQGKKETLIDDEVDRVEDAVSDGDYELAMKIVRKLQLDDSPLTIRERLVISLTNRDYLTTLHVIDRLRARKEFQ